LKPSTRQQIVYSFQGISNFRELGGYPTLDGRTIRRGILFRSGHLGKMTRKDQSVFNQLGINTVIDFRSHYERNKYPHRLIGSKQIQYLHLPILEEFNSAMEEEIRARIADDDFDPVIQMTQIYRNIMMDSAHAYRIFLETIAVANGKPVLWHCTAGKDRTGIASALLLRILGVPDTIILQDYLASAKHVSLNRKLLLLARTLKGRKAANKVRSLMGVHAVWLKAALQAMDAYPDGFAGYQTEKLAIRPETVETLRDNLLTP